MAQSDYGQVTWIVGLLVLALIVVMGAKILENYGDSIKVTVTDDHNESFLTDTSKVETLANVYSGSDVVTQLNSSWLSFDGDGDYAQVTPRSMSAITFWYKNDTSDWIFVANVSGTLYVDGSPGTPDQYPVYYNGTDYFLGQNSSTYQDVKIDDFRGFRANINSTDVEEIYTRGRNGVSNVTSPSSGSGTCEFINKTGSDWNTLGNCYGKSRYDTLASIIGAQRVNASSWVGQVFGIDLDDSDWNFTNSFYLQSVSAYVFQTGAPSYNITVEIRNETLGEVIAVSTTNVTDEGIGVEYPNGRLRFWKFDNVWLDRNKNYSLVFYGDGQTDSDYLRIAYSLLGDFDWKMNISTDSGTTFSTASSKIVFDLKGMIDLEESICLRLKFEGDTQGIAYDSSGCSDNATVTGATLQSDGIITTLVNNKDYSINSTYFQLTNSSYDFEMLYVNYSHSYTNTSKTDYALANDAAVGISEYGNWFTILVIIFIGGVLIYILVTSLANKSTMGGSY